MNILDLKRQIIDKKLNKIYYLTGDEWKVIQIYTHKIAEVLNKPLENIYSILDIVDNLKVGNSLLSQGKCYVIRDDKDFIYNEHLWNKIEELVGNNNIIFIFNTLDKRTKFYKQFKDNLIVVDKLNEDTLINYCHNEIDLSTENIKKLIEICEYDYGRCLLEIDKLKNYTDKDYNEAFDYFGKHNVIKKPARDAVFMLVDAILSKQSNSSFALYEECKEIGEANLVILTNLFTSAKQLLQVQSSQSQDISKETGINNYVVKKLMPKCNIWHNRELINIMKLCQDIEMRIKTGELNDKISVDYLLLNIFGGN